VEHGVESIAVASRTPTPSTSALQRFERRISAAQRCAAPISTALISATQTSVRKSASGLGGARLVNDDWLGQFLKVPTLPAFICEKRGWTRVSRIGVIMVGLTAYGKPHFWACSSR
jgi:hypothetical protein